MQELEESMTKNKSGVGNKDESTIRQVGLFYFRIVNEYSPNHLCLCIVSHRCKKNVDPKNKRSLKTRFYEELKNVKIV